MAVYETGPQSESILNGSAWLLKADRNPCPVCGHETGDCAGDSPPPTRVLGPDLFKSLGHENVFVATEDVWEQKQISGQTFTRVLVARKGQVIPMSKAQDLGLC